MKKTRGQAENHPDPGSIPAPFASEAGMNSNGTFYGAGAGGA